MHADVTNNTDDAAGRPGHRDDHARRAAATAIQVSAAGRRSRPGATQHGHLHSRRTTASSSSATRSCGGRTRWAASRCTGCSASVSATAAGRRRRRRPVTFGIRSVTTYLTAPSAAGAGRRPGLRGQRRAVRLPGGRLVGEPVPALLGLRPGQPDLAHQEHGHERDQDRGQGDAAELLRPDGPGRHPDRRRLPVLRQVAAVVQRPGRHLAGVPRHVRVVADDRPATARPPERAQLQLERQPADQRAGGRLDRGLRPVRASRTRSSPRPSTTPAASSARPARRKAPTTGCRRTTGTTPRIPATTPTTTTAR